MDNVGTILTSWGKFDEFGTKPRLSPARDASRTVPYLDERGGALGQVVKLFVVL